MNVIQTLTFALLFLVYMTTFLMNTLSDGFYYNFITAFMIIPLALRSTVLNGRMAVDWGFILALTMMAAFFMWMLTILSKEVKEGVTNFGVDKPKTRKVYAAYMAALTLSMLILIPMYSGGDPYSGMRKAKELNSLS